jgi:hypothetical protein
MMSAFLDKGLCSGAWALGLGPAYLGAPANATLGNLYVALPGIDN